MFHTDYSFSEWKYLRAKYGDYAMALDSGYKGVLEKEPELFSALMDYQKAKRVIDSIMTELADKDNPFSDP